MKRSKRTAKKKPRKKATELTEEQIQLYKDVFQRFDKGETGTISPNGLGIVMQALGQRPTEERVSSMIKQYDIQGNGHVTFNDFMAKMKERSIPEAPTADDLREAFEVFDVDGSGLIDADSFWETMNLLGMEISREEADELIKSHDRDGDGKVNLEDFMVMHAAKPSS